MTRLRRIEDRDRYCFVTTNLSRGARPLTPTECDLILKVLSGQRKLGAFFLFGYALMPTHIPLLLSTPNMPLVCIMLIFKSKMWYEILEARGGHGPFWQERYFDAIIRRVRNFWEKLEYIHRNPVEAGLVEKKEDWQWSSYRHYAKKENVAKPIDAGCFTTDDDRLC